jgi:hypothetical protein
VRTELLDQVANQINGYHVRPEVDYDYETVRKRLIFETLTQGVQYVCNNAVEGDIAEFGTASGFSAYTIARAMAFYQKAYEPFMRKQGVPRKALRLFDSFEGLPRADHEIDVSSPNVQSGRWRESTFKGLTEEELRALCGATYDKDKIQTYPGWFRDTLKTIARDTRFGMLHVDCDLYSSTVTILRNVAGMLAPGTIVIFDELINYHGWEDGEFKAFMEFVAERGVAFEYLAYNRTGGQVAVRILDGSPRTPL